MKKSLLIVFIALFTSASLFANGGTEAESGSELEKTKIVFTSWRTEDIESMGRINAVFMEANPDIVVDFQPIKNTEYDAQLMSSLETGVAADIMHLRSYDSGLQIWNTGKLLPLDDPIPALADFPSAARGAWSTEDGVIYGVPSAAVTSGIYYRKDLFAQYGLDIPEAWDEFIEVCRVLQEGGETVLAQGTKDGWHLYEVIFSGLGPNFYGGEQARQDLMAGRVKLTDPQFTRAFAKVYELQPFFPNDYQAIDYTSMQQLFGSGQAAMHVGGSWEIEVFNDLGSGEDVIGFFPPPVENRGDQLNYLLHVDAGIGVNKESKNLEAATRYIQWAAGPEYARLLMNELPGFFSYTPGDYDIANSLANDMIAAAQGADITVRTAWEKLSAQSPSGNILMWEALIDMYNGAKSPEEAAAHVQRGLDTWYTP